MALGDGHWMQVAETVQLGEHQDPQPAQLLLRDEGP